MKLLIVACLAVGAVSSLAAQATASNSALYRGTILLGTRVMPIRIRWSETADPRIQSGFARDDTTSRAMSRDQDNDTLLVSMPGLSGLTRFALRREGESLRGTMRTGTQVGTVALHRVIDLPLDVIKPRVGEYRLDDGALFSVGGAENAFDGLMYIHFGTGRSGSLFAVDSNRFINGPRRVDADPVDYTVQFEPGDRIAISSADGKRWRGTRTVVFREQEVTFPTTGGLRLAATYTVPTTPGPHPAVVMFHGSDPHTRFRGNMVTFFASRGLAVLSWDKRGNGDYAGAFATANIDTLAADGEAAIRWLRARPEIDPKRVGAWGISQGGWPLSVIAAHDSTLAFIIVHSGSALTPAVQGEDEMRMRVLENGGSQSEVDDLLYYYRRYLDVLRGVAPREPLDEEYRAMRAMGNRYIWSPSVSTSPRERWQRGINDFDPVPHWSKARVPVLSLFGAFDGYVPPETNVPVLRAAFARSGNRDTTIVVFPNGNHRLEESSQRISNDWALASRQLPEYYSTIATWLDKRLKK